MARIQAEVHLDPHREPEQLEFLRERVTVVRHTAGQCWVLMEEDQRAGLVAAGMEVYPQSEADQLMLPSVVFTPATETPEPPPSLTAPASTEYQLVHFRGPMEKRVLDAIITAGVDYLQDLPIHGAVFRLTPEQADALRGRDDVDHVGPYHPAYAVSLRLAGVDEPFTASSLRHLVVALPPGTADGNLRVTAFDGVDADSLRPALEAAGATIVADTAQGFQVQAPSDRVGAILGVPGIFAADIPVGEELCNNNAGVIIGTNQVRLVGTVNFLVNLDGRGELGAVVDSGFDVGDLAGADPPGPRGLTAFHPDLATNMRLLRSRLNPLSLTFKPRDNEPHGTHVAGTIAGDGTSSGGRVRGMAPAASLVGLGAGFPGPVMNINTTFTFAYQQGARVINNSWGTPGTNNDYTPAQTRVVDRWCFNHPDAVVLFASGNEEQDTNAGGDGLLDADRLRSEAGAKNALTVGASENLRNNGGWRDSYRSGFVGRYNHAAFNLLAGGPSGQFRFSDNADHVALFSSRGRVRDPATATTTRRIKPDVCAPGTNVLSLRSQWVAPPPALPTPPIPNAFYNANSDSMLPAGLDRNLYQIFDGTSMATPMTAGSALLVRQYFRTRFAQMRRPLLLQGAAVPAVAPFPVFGDRLAVSAHADGLVFAWVAPDLPANPRRIMAMRFSRTLAAVDAAPVQLQTAVGDHAGVRLARHGERTYLLHRHADARLRLSCYNRALTPEASFGTNGVVTLSPNARSDESVPPDLLVEGEHLVCVVPAAGGSDLMLQRFRVDTGAPVDAAPIKVLEADDAGVHGIVARGTAFLATPRFSVCGVRHEGNHRLLLRHVRDDGTLFGLTATILVEQAAQLREPNMTVDRGRHVIVWCDARSQASGEIYLLIADLDGMVWIPPHRVVTVPPANRVRRPRVLVHPTWGYLLAWEDDTQNANFDLYVTLLDDRGEVDHRIAVEPGDPLGRRLVRISDTPDSTAGFTAIADDAGVTLGYQSPDEVNSDRMGVYALNLTPSGAFQAQKDLSTPLQQSGQYVIHDLLFHIETGLTALSATWSGGSWHVLRLNVFVPAGPGPDNLEWARFMADGRRDTAYGVNGVRALRMNQHVTGCAVQSIGNRIISAANDRLGGITLYLQDLAGAPVATFGVGGAAALVDTEAVNTDVTPQVGAFSGPPLRLTAAYGTDQGGALHLRYQRLDDVGVRVGNAVDLAVATGVARHSWFQTVPSEARNVAIYHRVNGPNTRVHCRRFLATGAADGAERDISAAAGEATNAVLARRPTLVNSPQREYAAAWQHRANNLARWQISFSRLDPLARPMANPPAPARPITDVPVVAAGADWPADRDAVEPQLLSTYTDEPVLHNAPASSWTPSYGLAWIGVHPDGSRVLYFTALDANGQRLRVPQPPPVGPGVLNPPAPVPLLQISADRSNVRDFELVWNGRVFLLYWVEQQQPPLPHLLRHKCMMVSRHASMRVHDAPSAALIRATIVNGATNIDPALTPGSITHARAGYGWGRVNLRQTLSPAPPVTMHVRDDCALGPGGTASYRFIVPPGSALLRVTLNWTDPPGASLVNRLHLTVRAPAAPAPPHLRGEYRGNLWDTAVGRTHLSRPVANPPVAADDHEDIQIYKQVVVDNPLPGVYDVEVSAGLFPASAFNQQNLQAFAVVFAATGAEVRFARGIAEVQAAPVY